MDFSVRVYLQFTSILPDADSRIDAEKEEEALSSIFSLDRRMRFSLPWPEAHFQVGSMVDFEDQFMADLFGGQVIIERVGRLCSLERGNLIITGHLGEVSNKKLQGNVPRWLANGGWLIGGRMCKLSESLRRAGTVY